MHKNFALLPIIFILQISLPNVEKTSILLMLLYNKIFCVMNFFLSGGCLICTIKYSVATMESKRNSWKGTLSKPRILHNKRFFIRNIFTRKKASKMEAVVPRCSVKKVFLENPQNSQETTCARVSFLIKCRP